MKKNYTHTLFVFVFFTFGWLTINAQTPDTSIDLSTAASPVWYNMNSAATANGNAAIRPHATDASPIAGDVVTAPAVVLPDQGKDKYLWRFEGTTAGFKIINKLTGQQITNPATAATNSLFSMSATGSDYTYTTVADVTVNNVTGTAIYFTPVDAAYAAVGRINSQGTITNLVLFKSSTNGDISASGGGKGSLFWLRKVAMKTVTVTYGGTGTGTAQIMKDDGTTPEAVLTVSKSQSIGVTMTAAAQSGFQFMGWYDATGTTKLSANTTYTYSGTESVNIVAKFDILSGLNQLANEVKLTSEKGLLNVQNVTPETGYMNVYSVDGRQIASRMFNPGTVSMNLQSGIYIVKVELSGKEMITKVIVK